MSEDLNTGYKFGYKEGRRKGITIGATVTIPFLVIAYIISQGILYWKWLNVYVITKLVLAVTDEILIQSVRFMEIKMGVKVCRDCGHELDTSNHLLQCVFKNKKFGNEYWSYLSFIEYYSSR